MELINYEYILFLIGKFCLGVFTFIVIDIIFRSGLLGSNFKKKWINFLNSKDSTYIIGIVGFLLYLLFNIFEPGVIYAASDEELAKATLEASNVKISNFDTAIKYGANAGVFTGLYAATTKLAKTSSLPLGGKIAAGLSTSLVGLTIYKSIQEHSFNTRQQSPIIVQADNVKSNVSISPAEAEKLITNNDKSFPAKSMLDLPDNIGDKDYYVISQHGVNALYWDYIMHLGLIILIINVIVFITMKYLSEYDIKLNFVKNLPFGNYIYLVLNKLKDLWSKTTIIWIYYSLFVILIGTCFSMWSIYMVIYNLG